MPNLTENYGLKKPLADEFYDINIQNENMDVIDSKLKELDGSKQDVSGEINKHNTSEVAHGDIRNAISEAKQSASQALIDAKSYTDQKISAIPTPDVSGQINTHNTNSSAHNDIRQSVSNVQSNLNTHTANKNNPHGVTAAQVGAIPTSQKGVASGVATLDSNGKVPTGQLPEISSVKSATVTLTTSGWVVGTADERYYQTVNVSAITADTKVVVVDVDLSTDDVDAKIAYLEAWALPSANEVDQGNGTLTFYAWDKPTVNIPVNVGVM